MVAVCTGPAFATDGSGNLILAGERRKTNPSPCALAQGNGLYTDPAGGAWTVDQVSLCTSQTFQAPGGSHVGGGAQVPWQSFTASFTNSTCWAIQLNIQCTWNMFAWVNANTTMNFAIAASLNSTALTYATVDSTQYWPDAGAGAPTYFDWLTSHTRIVNQIRLEPHTTQSVTVGGRLESRFGVGGTLQWLVYKVSGWGYAVI